MASKIKLLNNQGDEVTIEHSDTSAKQGNSVVNIKDVTKQVGTIADLKALDGTHKLVYVTGYHTKGDGAFGSNFFEWDATSTEADNGGTIIKLDSVDTGRYKLKYSGAVNVKWFGANITRTDNEVPINNAIKLSSSIYIPIGVFVISDSIRESTNSYGLNVVGENKLKSQIVANPTMVNPIVWVGNSNGHGSYRGVFKNFSIVGNNNIGCHGLILQEAGITSVFDLKILDCDYGIYCPGMIGSQIKSCELSNNNRHIYMKRLPYGTPVDENDLTVTASTISLSTNINKVDSVWMSGGKAGVLIEGGLTKITGCTFQGVGNNTTNSVVKLNSANESFDYGGGSIVDSCWFEGGTYKYAIEIYSTRASIVRDNFISGNSTHTEGGILLYGSPDSSVYNNSIRGSFTATITESRLDNASIYITASSGNKCRIKENYLTTNTNNVYYEGETEPTIVKEMYPIASVVVGANTTILNSYNVNNVIKNATGQYRVYFDNFNMGNPTTTNYSLTLNGSISATIRVADQYGPYFQIIAEDSSGNYIDVDGFSLIVYGNPV